MATHDNHSYNEPRSVWPTVAICVVGFLLFGGLILFVRGQAGTSPEIAYEENRARERTATREELAAKDAELLNSAGWIDRAKGVAHIPIQRAIEIEVGVLRNKPIQPGVKIEPVDLAPSNITPPPPPAPGTF
jgi:hypothetical protein